MASTVKGMMSGGGRAAGSEGTTWERRAMGVGRCSTGLRARGAQGTLLAATQPRCPRTEWGTSDLRARIRRSRHNQVEASSPRRRHVRETLCLSRATLGPHDSGEKTRATNAPLTLPRRRYPRHVVGADSSHFRLLLSSLSLQPFPEFQLSAFPISAFPLGHALFSPPPSGGQFASTRAGSVRAGIAAPT